MAGQATSWIDQLSTQENPCISQTTTGGILGNCVLWLIAGLIIGSLTFEKKKPNDAAKS